MLRISAVENGNQTVTLKLEGSVAGPWVAEVKKVCDTLLINGHSLKLDLCDVEFVDRAGVALFADLRLVGASLDSCSPFVTAQLKTREEG